jgi:hypothetical protein
MNACPHFTSLAAVESRSCESATLELLEYPPAASGQEAQEGGRPAAPRIEKDVLELARGEIDRLDSIVQQFLGATRPAQLELGLENLNRLVLRNGGLPALEKSPTGDPR